MAHLAQIIFAAMLGTGVFLFAKRVAFVGRNINMGRDIDLSDRKAERWKTMARVAIGQSKMVVRPVAGILHIFVYVGFVIINIEMLEIVLDGLLGT
ncbi:MAG: Fe-S oxidoreductase, partial [Flavobacteriales bacterium]